MIGAAPAQFFSALRVLVGSRCGPAASDESGRLSLPLGAARLSVDCLWRVEAPESLLPARLLGPRHLSDEGRTRLRELLSGRELQGVTLASPARDLSLAFADGVVVRLFCDRRHLGAGGCHYRLNRAQEEWHIGPQAEVRRRRRAEESQMGERTGTQAFEEALQSLVGQRCWCAVPLSSEGLCHFGFGAKIPREDTLPNSEVPDVFRLYYAEFALIVECAWRVDGPERVIAGAREAMARDGRLPRALELLDGCEVEGAQVRWPSGDLTVRLSGGLELRLFCDRLDLDRGEDNYTLHGAEGEVWVVGPRGEVRLERGPSGPGPVLRVVR